MAAGLITPELIGRLIGTLIYDAIALAAFYFVIRLAVTSGVIKAEKKMAATHVSSKK